MKLRLRRADVVVALAIVGLAVVAYVITSAGGEGGVQAIVEVRGEVVATVDLRQDDLISVPLAGGDVAMLEVAGGRIRILDRDICPLDICTHTGWIERSGQAIVCLPNRIIVRIVSTVGANTDKYDAISGQ